VKTLVVEGRLLKDNLTVIKKRAGSAQVIADLSGNAQGMGLLGVARILREDGVRFFALSEPEDAELLRKSGFTEEQILMQRSTVDTDEIERLIDKNVIFTIGSLEAAVALNSVATAHRTVIEVQIKIDTGLGRYGFSPSETDKIENVFRHMPVLAVVGVYTRLSAPQKARSSAKKQLEAYNGVLERLQGDGFETGMTHALDSTSMFRLNTEPYDAICAGSALTGLVYGRERLGLAAPAWVEADIEEINWMQKGETIGDGAACKLRRNSRVGVLSVGWYNGLGLVREGQNEGKKGIDAIKTFISGPRYAPTVKVAGKRTHVLGRIGITFTLIDLTDIDCRPGDIAMLEIDPRMVKGLPITYR